MSAKHSALQKDIAAHCRLNCSDM